MNQSFSLYLSVGCEEGTVVTGSRRRRVVGQTVSLIKYTHREYTRLRRSEGDDDGIKFLGNKKTTRKRHRKI